MAGGGGGGDGGGAKGGGAGDGGGAGKSGGQQGGGPAKVEEVKPQPHPVMETLLGVQYCVNSPPPWPEAMILGFQHYFLSLGMTVMIPSMLVPSMGGGDREKARMIQNMLFVTGMNTLLQSLFGTRLPVIIAGSQSYVIPVTTILLAHGSCCDPHEDPLKRYERTMGRIQGALLAASAFQIIVGFLGFWRNFVRCLSPLSMVPLVTFSGLGLFHLGVPHLAECVEVGLPQLLLMIIFSQYISRFLKPKRRIWDRYALLFTSAIVWILAVILTSSGAYSHKSQKTQLTCRSDRAGLILQTPWFGFPRPFQWGKPTLRFTDFIAMTVASFVALTESTGTFIAAARYASATPVPPSVLGRSAGWLGVGTLLSGVFNCVTGPTASVENAGLLGLTRAGNRRVIQISAGFMIFFSLFGKLGAVLASVPLPIMAASYCIFFAYASAAGLSFLQFCNLNSFRTIFILGFTCFMAISVPAYFSHYHPSSSSGPFHTHSTWFNDSMNVIFASSAMVAAVVGLLLDNTMDSDDETARRDSGAQWWERFIQFAKDIRNSEFYSLPCKLNKFWPPL